MGLIIENLQKPISPSGDSNKFTLILDSSQIALYKECNEKWNLADRQLLKAKKPAQANRETMMMGSLGHLYLDIYYKLIANGQNFAIAVDRALKLDIDNLFCTCEHAFSDHASGTISSNLQPVGNPNKCLEETCYCQQFTPSQFSLPTELRKVVKDRVFEYVYHYNSTMSDLQPVSPEAMEVGFAHKLYEDSERLYILEGRIDMLATLQGMNCIVDHKFQKAAHPLYKKSIQFRNYAFVTQVNMLVINYIRFAQAKESTFVRDIASFTPLEHIRWRDELISIYDEIHNTIVEGKQFNRNWASCGGRFGYVCDFICLCEERDPDIIQIRKAQNFEPKVKFKVW